jgi:hypothetical protein
MDAAKNFQKVPQAELLGMALITRSNPSMFSQEPAPAAELSIREDTNINTISVNLEHARELRRRMTP